MELRNQERSGGSGASSPRRHPCPRHGALILVLALGAAGPARATTTFSSGTTNIGSGQPITSIPDNVVVSGTAVVNILAGGSVTAASGYAVTVNGGTLNVFGGSVTASSTTGDFANGGSAGVYVSGGTANISGGSISGDIAVDVNGGTATISGSAFLSGQRGVGVGDPNAHPTGGQVYITGGTISTLHQPVEGWGGTGSISGGVMSNYFGDIFDGVGTVAGTISISGGSISSLFYIAGTLNVSGCNLALSSGFLTGTLQSGQPINAYAPTLSNANLISTCPYTVVALYDQTKYVKSGATVPIKLQLTDANGVNVSSASLVLNALQVTNTGSTTANQTEASGNANPDNNFRYDASLNGYIYNLSTKGLATGAYTLSFTAGNAPPIYTVGFQVK